MTRVGIVTPCYNAAQYIERTIDSVKRQTLVDWEYVVVDDGSTDGSVEAIRRAIAGEVRARLIQQPNRGVASARNNGAQSLSTAPRYLVFLDADDVLLAGFLETMVAHLEAHPDVGLAYCGYHRIDESDRLLPEQHPDAFVDRFVPHGLLARRLPLRHAETPLEALVSYHDAIPSCCVVKRSTFDQTARWRPVGIFADKDFVLQVALRGPVHFVPQHLVHYRRHEANMSLSGGYETLRGLHRMWWHDRTLHPSQRRWIRRALVFDRQVAALMAAEATVHAWRAHDYWGGAQNAAVAGRHLLVTVAAGTQLLAQECGEVLRSTLARKRGTLGEA